MDKVETVQVKRRGPKRVTDPLVLNARKDRKRQTNREWAANNKERSATHVRRTRQKSKDKAIEYMGGKCLDCSGVFPSAVYDFHHLDPMQKDFGVGSLRGMAWARMKKELDKCIMLCSNCHRIRHYKEVNV